MANVSRDKGKKKNDNLIFTKETLGVVLILFATLIFICLVSGDKIFSAPGKYVQAFFFGVFGYFSYVLNALLIVYGVLLVISKKLPITARAKVLVGFLFVLASTLAHVITMSGSELTSLNDYLTTAYARGMDGISGTTGGGVLFALLAYPMTLILTEIGTYVVLGVLMAIDLYAITKSGKKQGSKKPKKETQVNSSFVAPPVAPPVETVETVSVVQPTATEPMQVAPQKPTQKLFVSNPDDFALKSNREIKKGTGAEIKLGLSGGGLNVGSTEQTYSKSYGEDLQKKIDYIKMPTVIDIDKTLSNDYSKMPKSVIREDIVAKPTTTVSDYLPKTPTQPQSIPMFEHEETKVDDTPVSRAESFADKYAEIEDLPITAKPTPQINEVFRPVDRVEPKKVEESFVENESVPTPPARGREIPLVEEKCEPFVESEKANDELPPSNIIGRRQRTGLYGEQKPEETAENIEPKESTSFTSRVQADGNVGARSRGFDFSTPKPEEVKPVEEPKKEKVVPPINMKYFRPPLDLLNNYSQNVNPVEERHEHKMEVIKRTLGEFNINAETQGYLQGPVITRYEIMMPAGVSVKKVLAFDDDLKMRLESAEEIRIQAPIPGKNLVGVEVANKNRVTVGLKEVLQGMAENPAKDAELAFAIGKDVVGKPISDDLAKGPHYLIAGATGMGKSVCLNSMIVSLIMRYSPEDLRFILIDPKLVGFRCYEHIPHLMIDEIITDPQRAVAILQWAYEEMERRYAAFASCPIAISKIKDYNKHIANETIPKMPRIVIFVDELADLMGGECKKDIENKIRALAQKSRAAGIHLVLATQRPSVDIVTGTIKANLPARIAFKVLNFQDSQTILSEGGAEKLVGKGDMLYKNSEMPGYERYQGAMIDDFEIAKVVEYVKEKNQSYFDDDVLEYLDKQTKPEENVYEAEEYTSRERDRNEITPLFLEALWLAVTSKSVAISQLQRRFQIGYAKAGALVDQMERLGYVSGNEGSKARRVLLTKEEYEARYGPRNDSY